MIPTSAPKDTVGMRGGSFRINSRGSVIECAVTVPAPLCHVARHVIKFVTIWRKRSDRAGVWFVTYCVVGVVATGRADIATERRRVCAVIVRSFVRDGVGVRPNKAITLETSTSRFLPFCFGRKTVTVIPSHHWNVMPVPMYDPLLIVTIIPKCVGYLRLVYPERAHKMSPCVIELIENQRPSPAVFSVRIPHRKLPCRNANHCVGNRGALDAR